MAKVTKNTYPRIEMNQGIGWEATQHKATQRMLEHLQGIAKTSEGAPSLYRLVSAPANALETRRSGGPGYPEH